MWIDGSVLVRIFGRRGAIRAPSRAVLQPVWSRIWADHRSTAANAAARSNEYENPAENSGIFQARRIQMNLMRKLVMLEGDRGSTIAAKHAARTGRRSIGFWHLSGKGKGLVGNTEPCSERGRGVAAAAFAVAMPAPVLRPGELERHSTAKTLSPLCHHRTSIHPRAKTARVQG